MTTEKCDGSVRSNSTYSAERNRSAKRKYATFGRPLTNFFHSVSRIKSEARVRDLRALTPVIERHETHTVLVASIFYLHVGHVNS